MRNDRYPERTGRSFLKMENLPTLLHTVRVWLFIFLLDTFPRDSRESFYKGSIRGFLRNVLCGHYSYWNYKCVLFWGYRFIAVDQCETGFTNDREGGSKQ